MRVPSKDLVMISERLAHLVEFIYLFVFATQVESGFPVDHRGSE